MGVLPELDEDRMDRHEMVKQFKDIFGYDQRYPMTVTTSDNPANASIQVDVNVSFGVSTLFKKRDIVKMRKESIIPTNKAKELREYLIARLEEKILEWRTMNV